MTDEWNAARIAHAAIVDAIVRNRHEATATMQAIDDAYAVEHALAVAGFEIRLAETVVVERRWRYKEQGAPEPSEEAM